MPVLEDQAITVFDWESPVDGAVYCLRCQTWISITDAFNEGGDSHVIHHLSARALMREIGATRNS